MKKFNENFNEDENCRSFPDDCHHIGNYRGVAHSICYLRYHNPVVFLDGTNYEYYFIVKELVETFEWQFERLGKNTEKYLAFLVPIKKEKKEQ